MISPETVGGLGERGPRGQRTGGVMEAEQQPAQPAGGAVQPLRFVVEEPCSEDRS